MKHVPNALSLSRIPLSFVLLWAAWAERWTLAAVILMVALATDALDGAIARRYHVESDFGGESLEPVCDLVLSVTAVGGLIITGVWGWGVGVWLILVTATLQASHATSFKRLKRHTYYIHPLFFVAVVFVVGGVYLWLAFENVSFVLSYIVALLTISWAKRDRWMVWLAGPPATS